VSGKFIDAFDMACPPEAKDALKHMMGHVHTYVTSACTEYFDKYRRHVYVTPKSYLAFIQVCVWGGVVVPAAMGQWVVGWCLPQEGAEGGKQRCLLPCMCHL